MTDAATSSERAEVDPPHQVAARVLKVEAGALAAFVDQVPTDFDAAVACLLSAKGRVIVSGMGKSGHIGRKIAATLASTGTPAFFVHPAEASHGDLGMVTPDDVAILISNSGEVAELSDITAHCLRFNIPIIGISKRPESTLMQAATHKLTLPDMPEACSIGMAPTTSTTLTLALGDALAVALMEQRQFQPEHFRTYHPGGKLGAQLATVAQLMHDADQVPRVRLDTPMGDTIVIMTARGFGVAAVLDHSGQLVGIVTDGDLRRHIDGLMDQTAGAVATKNPVVVSPDQRAVEAVGLMNERKIMALIVVDESHMPVGILHLHDCLRAGVV